MGNGAKELIGGGGGGGGGGIEKCPGHFSPSGVLKWT